MPRIASLPSETRIDTTGIGSEKSSSPGCLTGFKRFLHRLLARSSAKARRLEDLIRETNALRRRPWDEVSLDDAATLRDKVRRTLVHRSEQVGRIRSTDVTAERELRHQLQILARLIVDIEERYDIAPWRPFPKRH